MGKMKSWLMDQEESGVEVDKWPEMKEMLRGTGVDVSDIRAWVAKGNSGVAARNAEIEASRREAARPMDEMLDDVFSKVLGEDW